ncbi:MAG: choice-of-anchor C family protein [Acidobacteria bacterium]|nr:choice-of-anchor C family protein [Acidobacteriota bacterium]MCA1639627.1 choice-of-anchor C family protein [Acidobacteriota bacterium]
MKIRMMLMMFCVLAITPAVFAQSNGSFETDTNPGGFTTVYMGNTNIDDWSVDFGSIDYIGSYWQASEGVRSIDMSGRNEAGQISQTLTTVAGWTYQVTFDMSGNPDGGCGVKEMSVSVDGLSSQSYTYDTCLSGNTREDMKWAPNTYYFTATSSETVLTFTSLIAGFFGPALDNVNIEIVTQICHRNSGKKGSKTLTVGASAVAAHLAHGDSVGPCQAGDQ